MRNSKLAGRPEAITNQPANRPLPPSAHRVAQRSSAQPGPARPGRLELIGSRPAARSARILIGASASDRSASRRPAGQTLVLEFATLISNLGAAAGRKNPFGLQINGRQAGAEANAGRPAGRLDKVAKSRPTEPKLALKLRQCELLAARPYAPPAQFSILGSLIWHSLSLSRPLEHNYNFANRTGRSSLITIESPLGRLLMNCQPPGRLGPRGQSKPCVRYVNRRPLGLTLSSSSSRCF